jgi:hypothetical protein
VLINFNGVSTNQSARRLQSDGSSVSSSTGTLSFVVDGNTTTSSTFGNTEIYIPNYTSSNNKSVSIDVSRENNASTVDAGYNQMWAGLWSSTAAITSVQIATQGSNFLVNSTFSLYGLAAVGTTPATAPKATGGSIYNDGTYWYHVFASTGSFVPLTNLTANTLVVAGGGGGGTLGGGGGGAGGLITYTATSYTASLPYTMTIGAGGAGGPAKTANGPGIPGSNTYCIYDGGVLTAIGGGGGGSYNAIGWNGGSGSGSGGAGYAAGTGTSGQGNNGGQGSSSGSYISGGGGGGYSSAGGAASTNGGNGGNGWTIDSGTLNATPGMTILAAGGGGDCFAGYTPGTANAGAGKGFANGTASSATSYGSGGGGVTEPTIGGNWTAGGNGAGGVVIIRYAMA